MSIRYVGLNINDGTFTNSNSQAEHETINAAMGYTDESLAASYNRMPGCKLIKYECLNDPDFEFCNLMKLMTHDPRSEKEKRRAMRVPTEQFYDLWLNDRWIGMTKGTSPEAARARALESFMRPPSGLLILTPFHGKGTSKQTYEAITGRKGY